tara:strand:- start:43 stop:237 length:195 start_codon:yes stop_codon:yes gene_type:complete
MINRFGKEFKDQNEFLTSRATGRYTKDGNDAAVHGMACRMVAEVHEDITDEFFNRKKKEVTTFG